MKRKLLKSVGTVMLAALACHAVAQMPSAEWNTPGAGNPLIPGYFADPTIRKFGDTYYIYATTDGTGNGYGPAQVWISKDFVKWRNVTMNWPTTEVVWAPDVVQQEDGTFRYYYCQPCMLHVGESMSPVGPWKNRLGDAEAVLVPDRFVTNAITLDPQLFRDEDGAEYLYFGTWGIYDGFGCGVARLTPDGKSFTDKKLIPNTEIKDFFEAPFVFKKNGIYYFTYSSGSCHDHTYRVQYAVSKSGPMGPYEYKGCILETNADGTIHGPGHHSILVDGEQYYIVYHRHNVPHSIHGFHRQVCIDELNFDDEGNILKINPTHGGVLPKSLAKRADKAKKKAAVNIAYGAAATASSTYSEWFKPEYATDDNNATLWRAKNCNGEEWLCIDLGENKTFNQIWTQFEYATFFYQYKIETSVDGQAWTVYADRTDNTYQGSPMIDKGDCKARYIRITVTDTQKNGHFAAIWNVKVYNANKKNDPSLLLPAVEMDEASVVAGYPWIHKKDVELSERSAAAARGNKVIDINADDYASGKSVRLHKIDNRQGGAFSGDKDITVEIKKGKYAFYFNGQQSLTSDFSLPKTMTYNAPYTVVAWTLNPKVGQTETVAEFTATRNDLSTIEFRQGSDRNNGLVAHNASFENSGAPKACMDGEGQWQHWVVTFDGYNERIYLDGKMIQEKNMFLMIRPQGHVTLGSSMDGGNKFSGYLHSLQFYDKSFTDEEVKAAYMEKSDTEDKITFSSELSVSARPLSPSLVSISVTEKNGEPIESGLLTFSYGITSNPKSDECVYGEPTNSSSVIISTDGKKQQKCFVKIADDSGDFSRIQTAVLNLSDDTFKHFGDDASKSVDYLSNYKDCGWDGVLFGENAGKDIAVKSNNGAVVLSSSNTNFTADKSQNGILLYKEIEGDFFMQGVVADIDGSGKHSTPAYNEGGIMVLDDSDADAGQRIVHLGVFPNYNCGNMLTVLTRHSRPQYPNGSGWNYDKYLQIERVGDLFHACTSKDGREWREMPGSPVRCPQMNGKKLKVGLYQTTYSANSSWVSFDDFNLWQKK